MLSPYGFMKNRYHLTNAIIKQDILVAVHIQYTYQRTLSHLIPPKKSFGRLCNAFWLHSMPFKLHIKVKTFVARDALVQTDPLVLLAVTS